MANADELAGRPLPFVHLLVFTPCCCPFSQINNNRNREDQATECTMQPARRPTRPGTADEAVARRGREREHPNRGHRAVMRSWAGIAQYSWVTFEYCPRRNDGRLATRERRIWLGRLIT